MLSIIKKLFLYLFVIFFLFISLILFFAINVLYKTGELQDEIIPRIKYTLTDKELLFPSNDFQKKRRYMLWNIKIYTRLLGKLKPLEDGYIVSESDFENKAPTKPFADWNFIIHSKHTDNIFDLLIYGDLSETQKQAILDFYKMRDIAYYELALEIVAIKNPQSMKDFEAVQEKIKKLTKGVGYPEYYAELAKKNKVKKEK